MGAPDRVGCDSTAIGLSGSLLLVPTLTLPLLCLPLYGLREGFDFLFGDLTVLGWIAVGLVIANLPGCLIWWRFAGVSAARLPDGVRVRGMWRTREVAWSELLAVEATDYRPGTDGFRFSRTIVTVDGASGPRTAVVSRSFWLGGVNRERILSWVPAGYPLAADAPEPSPLPVTEPGADPRPLSRRSVVARLPVLKAAWVSGLVLLAVPVGAAAAYGLGGALARVDEGGGWWVAVALCATLLTAAARATARLPRTGTELTPGGLIERRTFSTRSYPIAAVERFVLVTQAGGTAATVLVPRDRAPTRLTGTESGGDRAKHAFGVLDDWLRNGGRAASAEEATTTG